MTKWKPEIGETYYIPDMFCEGKEDILAYIWSDSELDYRKYEAGIVCRTKEEAIELSSKMLMVAKEYGWISCENNNLCNEEHQDRLEDDYYTCGNPFDCPEFWFVMMLIFINVLVILYLVFHT